MDDLKQMISNDEKILYEGKPKKSCFILESIFNPMLPIALIWGAIDFCVLGFAAFSGDEEASEVLLFLVPFMALHLMPVWIYLAGVLLMFRRYRNTNYVVTDNGVYTSSGVFSKTFNQKPFAELSHADLHRGVFDQMSGAGDIIMTSAQFSQSGSSSIVIRSISDYVQVYNLVKKLQKDIYTDVMYPNDRRPSENHGYKTKYEG